MTFYNPYHFIPVTGKIGNQSYVDKIAYRRTSEKVEEKKGSDNEKLQINDVGNYSRHDFWNKKGHSGRLICAIKTESQLVVGNQHEVLIDDAGSTVETVVNPYLNNGLPAIPANSLRGMISSITETISQSAMRVLDDKRYSVRKSHHDSLSALGILVKDKENNWFIRPLCLPHLKIDQPGNTVSLQKSKWKSVFSAKDLTWGDLLPAYIGNYKKDENDKIPDHKKSFLFQHRNTVSSYIEGMSNFYYAKLDTDLANQKVNADISTSHSRLHYKQNSNNIPTLLVGQKLIDFDDIHDHEKPGYTRGVLYILGREGREEDIPADKNHELFIPYTEASRGSVKLIPIPPDVIENYCDIARFRNKENPELPYLPKGYQYTDEQFLCAGGLMYFDINDSVGDNIKVTEISRSAIWRQSSKLSTHEYFRTSSSVSNQYLNDVLPWSPTRTALTPAELMFGVVEEIPENTGRVTGRNLASRIRFSDAIPVVDHANNPVNEELLAWCEKLTQTPQAGDFGDWIQMNILASPKPPSPNMYFNLIKRGKPQYMSKADIHSNPLIKPNGRKHYLRHSSQGVWPCPKDSRDKNRNQKNLCLPIPKGQTFYFHVDYENLSYDELGLLTASLEPAENFLHNIGLGKPMGLGKIQVVIDALLSIERVSRYDAEAMKSAKRYHGCYLKSNLDVQQWPSRYAIETQHINDKEQTLENITLPDSNLIDEKSLKELLLLAQPRRQIYYPVTTKQETGARYGLLDKGYEWFVQNDGKDSKKQTLSPLTDKLQGLDTE